MLLIHEFVIIIIALENYDNQSECLPCYSIHCWFSKCSHFWKTHCQDVVIFRQAVKTITKNIEDCQS